MKDLKTISIMAFAMLLHGVHPTLGQVGAELGNPNPAQWKGTRIAVHPSRGGTSHGPLFSSITGRFEDKYHFTCDKPACPARTTVFFRVLTKRGEAFDVDARHTFTSDHEASMERSKWEVVEPLREGRFRGYPIYSGVRKRFALGVMEYTHYRVIFAKDTAITISGNAEENALARRSLDTFLPKIHFTISR